MINLKTPVLKIHELFEQVLSMNFREAARIFVFVSSFRE